MKIIRGIVSTQRPLLVAIEFKDPYAKDEYSSRNHSYVISGCFTNHITRTYGKVKATPLIKHNHRELPVLRHFSDGYIRILSQSILKGRRSLIHSQANDPHFIPYSKEDQAEFARAMLGATVDQEVDSIP